MYHELIGIIGVVTDESAEFEKWPIQVQDFTVEDYGEYTLSW